MPAALQVIYIYVLNKINTEKNTLKILLSLTNLTKI